MKKAILLIGILLTISLCCYYLAKHQQGFVGDQDVSYLGVNANGLVLCGPNCKEDSSLKRINTPERNIKQVVYNKSLVAILTNTGKVYICQNCPLHQPSLVNWKQVKIPSSISLPGPTAGTTVEKAIKSPQKIALDKGHLFVLNQDQEVFVCKGCNYDNPSFELLKLPTGAKFYDFMARNGSMIGVNTADEKVYGSQIYNPSDPKWTQLSSGINDESNLKFRKVESGPQGYLGTGFSEGSNINKVYFCPYPCTNVTKTHWRDLGSSGSTGIGYSGDYLTTIKGSGGSSKLGYCKYPCSNSSDWKYNNATGMKRGQAFSYLHPAVKAAPTIPALNAPSPLLTQTMNKIKNNTSKIQKIQTLTKQNNRYVALLRNATKKNNGQLKLLQTKSREESQKLAKQLKLSQRINDEFLTEMINKPHNAIITLDQPITSLLTDQEV